MSGAGAEGGAAPVRGREKRSFVRDAARVLTSNGLSFVFVITIGIVTARVWGADVRGLIAVAMNVPLLLLSFGDLGMKKSVPYLVGRGEGDAARVFAVSLVLILAIGLLGILFGAGYALGPFSIDVPVAWVLLAACIPLPKLVLVVARAFALGKEDIKAYAKVAWMRDGFQLLLLCVGALLLPLVGAGVGGWWYILAYFVAAMVFAGYALRLVGRHVPLGLVWDPSAAKELVVRGIPYALASFFMKVNYRVDIVLLAVPLFLIPKGDIGNYSVGVALANALWQLPIALNHVVFSRSVNERDPLGFARKASRLVRVGVVMLLGPAAVLFAIAPWLIPMVYGPGFEKAGTITQILLPGIVAFFAARTFEADIGGRGAPGLVCRVAAPMALANIVLNVALIPWLGVYGAAWASTITYALGALAMSVAYARFTGLGLRGVLLFQPGDFAFRGRGGQRAGRSSGSP